MSIPSEANPEEASGPALSDTQTAINALKGRFPEAAEDASEETDVQEEIEVEEEVSETEVEEEVEEEVDEAEEDDAEPTFESLSQLLEAGGVDPDTLQVSVKASGEELSVTLAEVIRGYQRQADYDKGKAELRKEKEAVARAKENIFEDPEVQERLEEFENTYTLATMVVNADAVQLQKDYDAVDWQKLSAENRTEYAALQADFGRRYTEIQQQAAGLNESYSKAKHQQSLDQARRMEKVKEEQIKLLMERQSDLNGDPDAYRTRHGQISEYLKENYNATDQEIAGLLDHRIQDIAWKARLYDEMVSSGRQMAKVQKKKVTPTLRPGRAPIRPQGLTSQREEKKAREKLSKTHSAKDAAAVLAARMRART